MSAGFTPGPWSAHDLRIVSGDGVIDAFSSVALAYCGRADAHLIAAAPELYDALIEARAEIARLYTADDLDCAVTIGEAALRLALGEAA
jgi:hypothetical protein